MQEGERVTLMGIKAFLAGAGSSVLSALGAHTSPLLTCAPQWEMFTTLTRMAQRQGQSLPCLWVSPLDILRTYFQKLLDSVG